MLLPHPQVAMPATSAQLAALQEFFGGAAGGSTGVAAGVSSAVKDRVIGRVQVRLKLQSVSRIATERIHMHLSSQPK